AQPLPLRVEHQHLTAVALQHHVGPHHDVGLPRDRLVRAQQRLGDGGPAAAGVGAAVPGGDGGAGGGGRGGAGPRAEEGGGGQGTAPAASPGPSASASSRHRSSSGRYGSARRSAAASKLSGPSGTGVTSAKAPRQRRRAARTASPSRGERSTSSAVARGTWLQ